MKTCPFCAEEIQDAAVVCKHCGRDLVDRPVETQYSDFVYDWPQEGRRWKYAWQSHNSEITIRLNAWQESQQPIMSELDQMFNQGWKSIDEIGPASIALEWENFSDSFMHLMSGVPASELGAGGCAAYTKPRMWGMLFLIALLTVFTGGGFLLILFIIVAFGRYGAPKQFKSQLRREVVLEDNQP